MRLARQSLTRCVSFLQRSEGWLSDSLERILFFSDMIGGTFRSSPTIVTGLDGLSGCQLRPSWSNIVSSLLFRTFLRGCHLRCSPSVNIVNEKNRALSLRRWRTNATTRIENDTMLKRYSPFSVLMQAVPLSGLQFLQKF